MSRKSLNDLDAAVREFNSLTGRPSRAYEPDQEKEGGAANIGYAYARCVSDRPDVRYAVSVIISYGGGVSNLLGLTGHPGDVLRALRRKLADPDWIQANQFDSGRWRKNPPIAHLSPNIYEPVIIGGMTMQILPDGREGAHALRVDRALTIAAHPNAFSCRCLLQRILQESEERALEQADYIARCGGKVDRTALTQLIEKIHPPQPATA